MAKVSIIIPVYKVEKYLRECLDSVINQTLEDIEIICVNDCSPDDCWEILLEYAILDDRVKFIDLEKNKGIGYARNHALSQVNSDYVMYLDSDDWLEEDACEKAYNHITKNDNDFVFFGICVNDEIKRTKRFSRKRFNILKNFLEKPHIKFSTMEEPYFSDIAPWNRIFKTSYIKDYNLLFDENRCYEDMPFFYEMIFSDPDFSILDEYLYNYRKRKGSITNNFCTFKDELFMRKKYYDYFVKYNSKKYTKAYLSNCIRTLWGHYKFFAKNNLLFEFLYYGKIRKFFKKLDKENDIFMVKDDINYEEFKKVLKHGLLMRLICIISGNIFSVRNTADKRHKKITIAGFKINIRKPELVPN